MPQLVRFILIGLLATGVHYGLLRLLVDVAQVPSAGVANGLAAIGGIATSYLGNRLFVFRHDGAQGAALVRFLAVYALVIGLHTGFIALWSDLLGWPLTVGFILATGGSAVTTFLANKYFVFSGAAAPRSPAPTADDPDTPARG